MTDQPTKPLNLVTDHCAHPWPQRINNGEPSQDVALSGTTPYGRYAIVGDGVSGGKHSDLGAKLIAVLVEDSLGRAVPDATPNWGATMAQQVHNDVMHKLHYGARTLMQIDPINLHCTTLFAFVRSDTGEGFVHVIGDGVVAVLGPKPDDLSVAVFTWGPANVPFTLAHMQDPKLFKQNHVSSSTPLTLRQWVWVDGVPVEDSPISYTAEQGMRGITMPIDLNSSTGVVLMSDGVTQISGVPELQAVWDMTRFKMVNATTLRRRFSFGLGGYKQHQKMLQDDLAGAAILVVPPPPPAPPPVVEAAPPAKPDTKVIPIKRKAPKGAPPCVPQQPSPSQAGSYPPSLGDLMSHLLFPWLPPPPSSGGDKNKTKK